MTHEPYDKKTASDIIAGFDARPEMLVQILHAFINRFAWISEDAIRQLAAELNLSRAEVHGVVRSSLCTASATAPVRPRSWLMARRTVA
jgi:NADH:ubiquinone oxidoreductase subunit E